MALAARAVGSNEDRLNEWLKYQSDKSFGGGSVHSLPVSTSPAPEGESMLQQTRQGIDADPNLEQADTFVAGVVEE